MFMPLSKNDIAVLDAAINNENISLEGTYHEKGIMKILGIKHEDLQRIFVKPGFFFINQTPVKGSPDVMVNAYTLTKRWRQLKSGGSYFALTGLKGRMVKVITNDKIETEGEKLRLLDLLLQRKQALLSSLEERILSRRYQVATYKIALVAVAIAAIALLAALGLLHPLIINIRTLFK
jgi:hypothetical protein